MLACMNRSRWVSFIVGGALALTATASAAAPALADDGAAVPSPNLEIVTAKWVTAPAGKVELWTTVRNVGSSPAERPWLFLGIKSVPAAGWQPACLELRTAADPGPMQSQLTRDRAVACLLAPLGPGEIRQIRVAVPEPAPEPYVSARGTNVWVAGEDGKPFNVVHGTAALPWPPGVVATVKRNQRPVGGLRITLRGLRAGKLTLSVELRNPQTGQLLTFDKVVRFAKRGTKTVTIRAKGKTLRQLRRAIRGGASKATVDGTFSSAGGWGGSFFTVTVPISQR